MRLLGYAAGIYCGLLALIICVNYFMQVLAIGSLPWLSEVVEYTLYATVFLAAPWILHHNAHVGIDLLVTSLSPRSANWLNLGIDSFGLLIAVSYAYLAYYSIGDAIMFDAVIRRYLAVPEWWLLYVFLASMILIAVEFLNRINNRMRSNSLHGATEGEQA
jgi:TRAP-type C4-dicarboxylate transport system permease small subunit